MKITNNSNLPAILYDVLAKDFYNFVPKENEYSVTELLNPVKQVILRRRHREEIEQDASDLIYRTWGNLMHQWLENFNEGETLKEERLKVAIDKFVLTGKIDLYFNKTLFDYKMTSVWSWIYKSRFEEWKKQLNMYGYLSAKTGFDFEKLKNIIMFRDWSKMKARTNNGYPKQVEVMDVEIMSLQEVEDMIRQQLCKIELCNALTDDNIQVCSQEERWESKTKYAIMKEGRKSAVKLFEDKNEAISFLDTKGKDHRFEKREGEPKRCLEYCDVNKWCSFFKVI